MTTAFVTFRLAAVCCILSVASSYCLGRQATAALRNPLADNAPEPLWLFDNVETDYISTPVLALRRALRDQVRKERNPATLRKDRAAAEQAQEEIPHYRNAWVKNTSKEDTFSPETRKLRKELRDQIEREYVQHYPRTQKEREAQIQRSLRYQRARVTLKGTVTDEAGDSLSGVGISIREAHGTFVGDNENRPETNTRRRVRADGDFTIVCDDVNAVFLTFRAAGYFQVKKRFVVPHPPDYLPLETGKKVTFDNIHVVMEKAGKRAKLDDYRVTLASQLNGPVLVGNLALMGSRKRDLSQELNRGEAVTFPRVFAEVTYPGGQSPPSDTKRFARDVISGEAKVSLHVEDSQGGGFILVDPGERYYPRIMKDLVEAPSNGYQPSIEFTADQAARLWNGNALPFFSKLNGLYGKGGVFSIRYQEPFGVRIAIKLNMQPDGSRNLLTRE